MNPPSALIPLLVTITSLTCIGTTLGQPIDGSPYTAWASDYTGNETHTIGLWKFNSPDPTADAYTGTANPKAYPTTAITVVDVTTGNAGKFGQGLTVTPPTTPDVVDDSRGYFSPSTGTGIFNSSALSVELWYQTPSTIDSTGWLFNALGHPTNNKGGIALQVTSTELILHLGNGSIISTVAVSAPKWQIQTWYHFAVTFENVNGDGVASIYMNGNRLGGEIVPDFGDLTRPDRFWAVGNRNVSNWNAMHGMYDNFRIADIAYNYAPIPEPHTAAYLLMTVPALALGHRFLRRK